MSKRRGRERWRESRSPRCVTGEAWSQGGGTIPQSDRDQVTAMVVDLMRKYGVEPADPLEVRDVMFGGGG